VTGIHSPLGWDFKEQAVSSYFIAVSWMRRRRPGLAPRTKKKAETTKDTKVARRLLPRILRVPLVSFVVAFDLAGHGLIATSDCLEVRGNLEPVHVDEKLGTALLVT
jgi:hypothetical protein